MILAGAAVLTRSFAGFVVSGAGTPMPVAPPRHLVVTGLYRYVRNPMYVAMLIVIIGQGLLLGQPRLFTLSALVAVPPALYVPLREEPELAQRFGTEYTRYCRNVPRWIPRPRPWTQHDTC